MVAKYFVYAGCTSEGQILNGQPYDGALNVDAVTAFALESLRNSPYHSSNTAFGLAECDWVAGDSDGGAADFIGFEEDPACFGDCEGDCDCEPEEYWLSVQTAD